MCLNTQTALIAASIIVVVWLVYWFIYRKPEGFRITTAPRPKTFDEINTGAPLDEAYNNIIFEERNCSGAPGMEYLL